MKKLPRLREVVNVYDDLKNRSREAVVTSIPVIDETLGPIFDIRFLDTNMTNVAYWSIFHKSWCRYDIGGGTTISPTKQMQFEGEEYDY